ncbi:hypothetical protein STA3757_03810 [Stanieria sp. NIES-3757]|nr:hypothetical protein STA3757_03810 [Stanieria sp. NIES-3757]
MKIFPGSVVEIINLTKLVIDRGFHHDIRLNQRMSVYCLSKEKIFDSLTKECLGYLEIYKGTGKVIDIQQQTSVIEFEHIFQEPSIGDLVKPI